MTETCVFSHPKQQEFLNPSTFCVSAVILPCVNHISLHISLVSIFLHIFTSFSFTAPFVPLFVRYCCSSISHHQACVWFTSLNLNGPLALMFGKRNISHNKNIRQNMCHGRFFNKASTSFSRHTPLSQGLFSSPNPSHPPPHCPFSSRVICSVSCLPLLAFPLHLWLANLCRFLIGQSSQDLPLLTLMKTSPPHSLDETPSLSEDGPLSTLRLF